MFINDEMLDFQPEITSARIQKYLETINSWLAQKECNGKKFSEFLYELCDKYKINQIWMLASVQKEQSALFKSKPPSPVIQNKILGYAITESGKIPGFDGFETQFKSAIKQLRRYDSWNQVTGYETYVVKLFDDKEDRDELAKKGIKYTGSYTAQSKGEAKCLLYTPRLAPMIQMSELYNKIKGVI